MYQYCQLGFKINGTLQLQHSLSNACNIRGLRKCLIPVSSKLHCNVQRDTISDAETCIVTGKGLISVLNLVKRD
jgi:hypothetical protein